MDTCGRSNPDTFESDDVARSDPVSTVVSTANQKVFAVLVGLRFLGKTPNLYSRLSIHTFSRSSTPSSVQIKRSYLTLVVFSWVLPLLWHTASNEAKYLH